MSKLKLAIIGLGNMGRHHVRHSQLLPDFELVGVCDTNEAYLHAFQSQNPGIPTFTRLTDLITNLQIDIACVVVPTSLHSAISRTLLMHGIHVLVEKPIASTVAEAKSLMTLATEHKKRLFVGHVEFFNPAIQAFLTYIRSHDFGQLRRVAIRRWSPMPSQITDTDVVADLCVHDLHILTQLFSDMPKTVTWHTRNHQLGSRADTAIGVLGYPTATVSVEANWISPVKVREWDILSDTHLAKIDLLNQTLRIDTGKTVSDITVQKAWPLETELAHVASSIRENRPSPIDAIYGLQALHLTESTTPL